MSNIPRGNWQDQQDDLDNLVAGEDWDAAVNAADKLCSEHGDNAFTGMDKDALNQLHEHCDVSTAEAIARAISEAENNE